MQTITHKGREYRVEQAETLDNIGATYTVTSPRGNLYALIETVTPGVYAMGALRGRPPFTFVRKTRNGWEVTGVAGANAR